MSIPLTPKSGGVCITSSTLQHADIIVSTIISVRADTRHPGQIPQACVSGILQYIGHLVTST